MAQGKKTIKTTENQNPNTKVTGKLKQVNNGIFDMSASWIPAGEKEKDPLEISKRDLIIAMLAANQLQKDIKRAVKQQLEIDISLQAIGQYKTRCADEIQKMRTEYIKNITNLVPIANIVNRALIRQRLINDLIRPGKLWRKIPVYYKGELVDYKVEGSHSIINEILDSQARELSTIEDQGQRREMFDLLKHSGAVAMRFIIEGKTED